MTEPRRGGGWGRRLLWFVGLWLAGVATVSVLGFVLRLWLT
ncbi:MAG TPA: hypothetical protein VNS22_19155 [Geminicoccus sp.]|nr:hypothetical protein [Geminicoccus sp.]HWL70479.1 hypothetical protein [Geminicoccus sp.]